MDVPSVWNGQLSDIPKMILRRVFGMNHEIKVSRLTKIYHTGKGDIAVAVSQVFEAQTFSNFFRFPMIFLCGLFFPIDALPVFLKPLSYMLPLTYGANLLHGSVHGGHIMRFSMDLAILGLFCVGLFMTSLRNVRRSWIA